MRGCITLLVLLLGGCADTLTGVEGKSGFSCKAPEGVVCSSLSGVYANVAATNLPGRHAPEEVDAKSLKRGAVATLPQQAPSTGEPIRSQPSVLRLWLAPWEDADGDLHDQSYVYVVADPGRWQIEHQRKQLIDRYRPVFVRPSVSTAKPAAPGATAQSGSGPMPLLHGDSRGPAAAPNNEGSE
jgi:conjugal transfer pilus assembly protein TraV